MCGLKPTRHDNDRRVVARAHELRFERSVSSNCPSGEPSEVSLPAQLRRRALERRPLGVGDYAYRKHLSRHRSLHRYRLRPKVPSSGTSGAGARLHGSRVPESGTFGVRRNVPGLKVPHIGTFVNVGNGVGACVGDVPRCSASLLRVGVPRRCSASEPGVSPRRPCPALDLASNPLRCPASVPALCPASLPAT